MVAEKKKKITNIFINILLLLSYFCFFFLNTIVEFVPLEFNELKITIYFELVYMLFFFVPTVYTVKNMNTLKSRNLRV
jgi:hypothetical protein